MGRGGGQQERAADGDQGGDALHDVNSPALISPAPLPDGENALHGVCPLRRGLILVACGLISKGAAPYEVQALL
jgi:hypothetical protein